VNRNAGSTRRGKVLLPALLALAGLGAYRLTVTQPSPLSFEDRVRAQEAIERVYYSHQIGATRPFEEVVPRKLVERKVRTYLKESLALEQFWKTPVTAAMLRAEMERMARQTRMPGRLRELYAALGNDPVLIQECLARPVLTNRLIRKFFTHDRSIHEEARRTAESLRADLLNGRIDANSAHRDRAVVDLQRLEAGTTGPASAPGGDRLGRWPSPPRLALPADEFDAWLSRLPMNPGDIGPIEEEPEAFRVRVVLGRSPEEVRLATYTMKKRVWEQWWQEVQAGFDDRLARSVAEAGAPLAMPAGPNRVDPDPAQRTTKFSTASQLSSFTDCAADDTWDNGSLDDLPDPRWRHTAVWTGSVMIVWGGRAATVLNTGGRYDPATDTWQPTSIENAPAPREGHTAVWTGLFMVVWGGFDGSSLNTGGRYDPATDTWLPTSIENAPEARSQHTGVWTGSRMVVWGGSGVAGGSYDPESDTWTPTSTVNAPSARSLHTAVWTGVEMLVWGGRDCSQSTCVPLNTGGRYDAGTDSWLPISTANAPSARFLHTAVWTGDEMIVWGGSDGASRLDTGGRYDPATDTWTPTSTADAPESRSDHHAVWTGEAMVVWGGFNGSSSVNTGARYDPRTDIWSPTSTVGAPSDRQQPTVVWTGSLMIIWGGQEGFLVNTGARYDPGNDVWTPTSTMGAPSPRRGHTAVWTGNVMIIWGGGGNIVSLVNTGGRYDPATDSWTPSATPHAPTARWNHTAVWTGREMVVWGGEEGSGIGLNTGGRYDPITDSWTPTATGNAPSARTFHTAVWTGARMIVWGGAAFFEGYVDTGGRYDPETDTWTPTSTINAPAGRYLHTAIWTDSQMIVWGGTDDLNFFDTGGRYDPASDTWSPTSVTNAPVARYLHTTIWTGDYVIVWGGTDEFTFFNTGGRYDPATDTWTPTQSMDAPSGRSLHTAVWSGSVMILWGGYDRLSLDTGGLYDPSSDAWTLTSTMNAPSRRRGHTAVWTDGQMIIWGGSDLSLFNNGGRYCSCSQATYYLDADGDGYGDASTGIQSCVRPEGYVTDATDCNDADAGAWGTPSEVRDLQFTDAITLVWLAPLDLGATSVLYDLIRSGSASDFLDQAACVASDTAEIGASDWEVPLVGRAFHYLARAENACPGGQGSLGTDSNGTSRSGRSCP
jgi:N-acetylneuraminic acid mutarotase